MGQKYLIDSNVLPYLKRYYRKMQLGDAIIAATAIVYNFSAHHEKYR